MSEQTKQAAPTVAMRGSSGAVFVMDLPLNEHLRDQVAKGLLTEVHADGTPLGPVGTAVVKPGKSDPKRDWITYAIAQGAEPKDVSALTLPELIAMYG